MSNEKQMPANAGNAIKKFQEETVDIVLRKVAAFQESGELNLPKDYSPGNALKSAWFILLEAKTSDKKPVLEACSKDSIANALLKMVVEGLSPFKKQCDFIAYGNKLVCQREYYGNIALAKRYAGIQNVVAEVIYEGDDFQYAIDPETGRKKIIRHEQKIENINTDKIRGAYAMITEKDGSKYLEVMSMPQIKKAWEQGPMAGQSGAHKNFTDQMAKKTVINRACKLYISTSDDSSIVDEDNSIDLPAEAVRKEISEKANNSEEIGFAEAEVINSIEHSIGNAAQQPEIKAAHAGENVTIGASEQQTLKLEPDKKGF